MLNDAKYTTPIVNSKDPKGAVYCLECEYECVNASISNLRWLVKGHFIDVKHVKYRITTNQDIQLLYEVANTNKKQSDDEYWSNSGLPALMSDDNVH